MSAHLEPTHALALAALADDDPERVAALAHAHHCAQCAALLDDSTRMLSWLDDATVLPAVSVELKARVERKVWAPRWDWSYLTVLMLALVSFWLVLHNPAPAGLAVPKPMRCALYEAGFAMVPLVVGAALSRFGRVRLSPGRFASYTMAFAVVAQLQLRTHCAAHDLSVHLFVFHFLVVLVMGVAGAVIARALAARA